MNDMDWPALHARWLAGDATPAERQALDEQVARSSTAALPY